MSDLVTIADQGDSLAMLKALRHKLAETIDTSKSGRDIAALARQLQIVSAQIGEIEDRQSSDPIADILNERKRTPVRDSNRRPLYSYKNDSYPE